MPIQAISMIKTFVRKDLKIINILLLVLTFSLAWNACDKDDNGITDTPTFGGNADLFISFYPAQECSPRLGDTLTIYTDPATDSTTFIVDKVPFTHLIEGVPIGFYEIYARNSAQEEAGFAAVVDTKDSTHAVRLCLEFPNYPPAVSFLPPSPGFQNSYAFGDELKFRMKITDDRSPSDSIEVKVELMDPEKWFAPPEVEATIALSGEGIGEIVFLPEYAVQYDFRLTATDSWGKATVRELEINYDGVAQIQLTAEPVGDRPHQAGVKLEWTKWRGPNFEGYKLWRTGDDDCGTDPNRIDMDWEEIGTFQDSFRTTHTDDNNLPIAKEICYCMQFRHPDAESNIVSLDNSSPELLTSQITNLIGHPTERIAYGFQDNYLVKINVENLQIETRVEVIGNTPSLERSPDGTLLLYMHSDAEGISIYDPITLRKIRTVPFSIGEGTVAVFPESNAAVVFRWDTSNPYIPNEYGSFVSINLTDGTIIDEHNSFVFWGKASRVPGKMATVALDHGTVPNTFYYLEIDNQGHFSSSESQNLFESNVVRQEWLQADPQGRYRVNTSTGEIRELTGQFPLLGTLATGSNLFASVAFDQTGDIIFAGLSDSNDEQRYIERIQYPSLTRGPQILTDGYVHEMTRAGDRIIAITSTEGPYASGRRDYFKLASYPVQ